MNQGIYREGGVAAGLPLPRTRLGLVTALIVVLAVFALVMPLALLVVAGRSPSGGWMMFKMGGAMMWLVLLLELGAPLLLAVLGVFVARGKKIPAVLLFVIASLPMFVSMLGSYLGTSITIGAIAGESVDPEQKARILAEGIAESMSCDIYGGFVATGAAIVACVAAASAVATIDTRLASGGTKPSSLGTVGPIACGALWFLATLVLGVLRLRNSGGIILLSVLVVGTLVPFAVLAGRGASILRSWHDRDEASRASGALLIAGLAAVLAVLALERAIDAAATSTAFGAISGESVDDSQRARILAEAISATSLAPASYAVHAVLGTATFALALAPSIGATRHPFSVGPVIALAVGALVLAGTMGVSRMRWTSPKKVFGGRKNAPEGVTLPVLVETFSSKRSGGTYGQQIIVKKDGTGTTNPPTTCTSYGARRMVFYADRDARFEMVRARLPKTVSCTTDITFVTDRSAPTETTERLGDYAMFLGGTGYVTFTLDDGSPIVRASSFAEVRSLDDTTIEVNGARVALSAPPSPPESDWSATRIEKIRYRFRPDNSVDQMLRVVSAAEKLLAHRISSWNLERVIDVSR